MFIKSILKLVLRPRRSIIFLQCLKLPSINIQFKPKNTSEYLFSMFRITFFQSSGLVVAYPKTLLLRFYAPVYETVLFQTIQVRILVSLEWRSSIFQPQNMSSSSLFFLSKGRAIFYTRRIQKRLSKRVMTSMSMFSSSSSQGALK